MATTAFPTSPSFAGHETFTLRYGWLKKAVDAVHEDPLVFTREDALVRLGVGKNMVRSIRHWGVATGILEEDTNYTNNRGRSIRPSPLGKLLFSRRGLDPYLEDPATLWLLHWQLASTPEGPTTWYWAFNHFPESEFSKDKLLVGLQSLAEQAEWDAKKGSGVFDAQHPPGRSGQRLPTPFSRWKRVASNSLRRDVDCFIRTYVPSRATRTLVLEETLDCPLAELGLIQEIDAGRLYAFVRDEHLSLSAGIFAFALLRYWETGASQRQTLSFDEVAYRPGSPGRVFKLSENALTEYLESIEQFTERAITYDVTAGLRQLYRRKAVDPLEVLCEQYTMTSKA
jgi:hypothetical protein